MRTLLRSSVRSLARLLVALRLDGAALWLADRVGRGRRGAAPRAGRKRDRYQILMYHRVNDAAHPFFPAVPVETFRRQMEALARRFDVLPIEELVARSASGDLPPRAAAITFDDGYRDNYQHAFPILRDLGLPATIYLATGAIERRIALWHDRVFDAFRATRAVELSYGGETWPLHDAAARRHAIESILGQVKLSAPDARESQIAELVEGLGVQDPGCDLDHILEWDEIRAMAEEGISFGAHTESHTIVTNLAPEALEREMRESKRIIEEKLERPVTHFAYPNGSAGDFDDATKEIVVGAGFQSAVTTLWGDNDATTDPFELRRVSLVDSDPRVAVLRLGLGL